MFTAELMHGTKISLSISFYSQSERNQNDLDVQISCMNTLILRERSLERIR
jgi:CDP-diacylglycerol pyrophosphatase